MTVSTPDDENCDAAIDAMNAADPELDPVWGLLLGSEACTSDGLAQMLEIDTPTVHQNAEDCKPSSNTINSADPEVDAVSPLSLGRTSGVNETRPMMQVGVYLCTGHSCSSSLMLEPGGVMYCHLIVRGVTKPAKVVVVEPGTWQTVVACPGSCALTTSGDWAHCGELGTWQRYECGCVDPGTSCDVVFYSVDTCALRAEPIADAIDFQTLGNAPVSLSTKSVVELFHTQVAGDSLRMETGLSTTLAVKKFHEVRIGEKISLFDCNSVLLAPDFLTKEECNALIDSADRRVLGGCMKVQYQDGLNRLPVRDLDLEAQMLSTNIIKDKLFAFLEQQLPQVCENLFGRSSKLRDMHATFSQGEPAVNRYMAGGAFAPHKDQQSVTINVLLSELGAFGGGGTMFWPQCPMTEEEANECVLLRPPRGMAVIFNGNVQHAGRPVTSGIRHLFVASFSLWSLDD